VADPTMKTVFYPKHFKAFEQDHDFSGDITLVCRDKHDHSVYDDRHALVEYIRATLGPTQPNTIEFKDQRVYLIFPVVDGFRGEVELGTFQEIYHV